MFVTKRKFEQYSEHTEREFQRLRDQYWVLSYKHRVLLDHLGLEEVETPAKTELRQKPLVGGLD